MMKVLCALCMVLLIASCNRDIDPPQPQAEPLLKRTIQRNPSGLVMRVVHFNEHQLPAFDTSYAAGTQNPGFIYVSTYNAKGKRTRMENMIPVLLASGYYWAYDDVYLHDTIPIVSYRYLKGNTVARIAHIYNASGQLIQDSTYHTPNYGTYTYLTNFTYDGLGRLNSSTDLNDTRDTTNHTTYQYSANRVEKSIMTIDYAVGFRNYAKIVTDYTTSGKILSEKGYNTLTGQLVSQTDYIYDFSDHLLNKRTSSTGNPSTEERYFNDNVSGRPEKVEYYSADQLRHTVTYYYE